MPSTQRSRIDGTLVTPTGLARGTVEFGQTITGVDATRVPPDEGPSFPLVLPGFIDVHVHGGGGSDTMDGTAGLEGLARFHLAHGTTSICPTTITNPWEAVMAALEGVREVRDGIRRRLELGESPGLPDVLGAHLEGPFINPSRLGAQPPYAVKPSLELVQEAIGTGVLRLVTLAPELDGAEAAAAAFVAAGVAVSTGHTRATFEEAAASTRAVAEAGGMPSFTHLFNAMGGMEGRAPGVVAAALASRSAHAELIFDTHHVHAGSFLAALAALGDRLLFVTDAIRAAGLPDGPTELGGQSVTVAGGVATLADGTLAGSVLTMDQALRNAHALGLSWPTLASLTSGAAARYLGLNDRGVIAEGKRADLVVLDEDLTVRQVFVAGHEA